jgi:rare lipoprotein A (peptidoglycan hydrolase)
VRTRIIVAFAALMAAAALVAVPEPAGSHPPSPARTLDPAGFTAVTAALSTRDVATTSIDDIASGPADPGPVAAWVEPGAGAAPTSRPRARQPALRMTVLRKNPWRFDPDISWYGPGFYGSGTACGQEYTRELMGVAHRTLPCGTLVTFRNPANGRTVTVPVIDRGPYVAGRTWDMSRALCEYLDHCYTGSIEWRLGGHPGG